MDGGAAGAPSPELMRWFCFLSLLHQHQCAEDDLIAAIAGWQSLRPPRVLEMSSSDAPKAPSMSASCGLWGGMADHTVALEFAMIVATATVAVAGVTRCTVLSHRQTRSRKRHGLFRHFTA